ncbi:MAG TPA: hypothetical protein PKV71_17610, partial [Calditrichia bacterium]|nr:hypothetical protein [Calditrichia bacterium]
MILDIGRHSKGRRIFQLWLVEINDTSPEFRNNYLKNKTKKGEMRRQSKKEKPAQFDARPVLFLENFGAP